VGTVASPRAGLKRQLRLLFLLPFPPDLAGSHGGSRAVASIIGMLSRHHDVAVLYLQPEDLSDVRRPLTECSRMVGIAMPAKRMTRRPFWSRFAGAVRLLLGSRPDWVRESWSTEMAAACANLAREFRPDVVHVELHVMAQYIPFIKNVSNAPCIVTEHEPGISTVNREDAARQGPRRRLSSFVQRLAWRRYEREALSRADAIITFTVKDEQIVREIAPAVPVVTTMPLRLLGGTGTIEQPIGSDLLFVGAFRHPPNVDAAMRLATAIFPRVREDRPGARMFIVGADPPPELIAAAGEGVSVTGWVENVAPYIAGASIIICPLREGGGMRVKVLEACAHAKALIATQQAVEGLDLRPGIDFVLATTNEEFAQSAICLLSDTRRRDQLGQAAHEWAQKTQNEDAWAAQYDELYRRLIGHRAGNEKWSTNAS
jgi:polysaccharide biosynthesis protein PslH